MIDSSVDASSERGLICIGIIRESESALSNNNSLTLHREREVESLTSYILLKEHNIK